MNTLDETASDVREWVLRADRPFENPFTSVAVRAQFTSPSGSLLTMDGFYDGDSTWRIRFNPRESGTWRARIRSYPPDPSLERNEQFHVRPSRTSPFLRATPQTEWGFSTDDNKPVLIFGDTVYHLFAMAHCGIDVERFLRRRAEQGFNLIRVRIPVSPFHPPAGHNTWQTRSCWPWGGSEQAPQFDRFNLDYFSTVDRIVRLAEKLGLHLEMIMEAWGFDFPFNNRAVFTAEWEELWLRYLISRYDAFAAVGIWTPMNEYEYYPDGNPAASEVANRWMLRVARLIREFAPHRHVIGVHNAPIHPPFRDRFAIEPGLIDAVMLQAWGRHDADEGWLATGLENSASTALEGWEGSAVLAEYGYEANLDLPRAFALHDHCNASHTRRGAWRGAFAGLGVITGFENSWGPFNVLDEDQAGMTDFLHFIRFFNNVIPFETLRVDHDLVRTEEVGLGRRPLALSSSDRRIGAIYLPVGGTISLDVDLTTRFCWYDPHTGESHIANKGTNNVFASPIGQNTKDSDWVLYWSAGAATGL